MSFSGNQGKVFEKENNAGGMDYVPPTCRLRAACVAAYVTAYVERTGKPRSVFSTPPRLAGHPFEKLLKKPLGRLGVKV